MEKQKIYSATITGLGRIGFSLGQDEKREQPASHTMAILGNKRLSLVAGADIDAEKRENWRSFVVQKNKKVCAFDSSSAMFSKIHPEIAVVSVNESAHLEECLRAIEAKPRLVILEKPVAVNSKQAQKIRAVAKANDVPVMVNHERRFSADYIAAKDFLPQIGEIQMVRAELCSGLRVWAKQFEESGEYSLIHDGTHLVDIVRFVLGAELFNPKVESVFKDDEGIVRNFTARYETERIPEILITMSGRSRFFSFGIDILGTLGRICVGNGYAKFYERTESKLYSGFYSLESKDIKLPKKTGYFSGMIQNAVDFLDGKADLKSPLEEAIADLVALEEIKKKLQK